ncbi:MAG: hypothetical protein GXP38_13235 [Chloroflexi bacterium]|nr:hypothetical protein [Chloroflexota bacterium]
MSDIQARLDRLRKAGRLKRRSSRPAPASPTSPQPPTLPLSVEDLRDLPEVEEIETAAGSFLLRTIHYDLRHRQGTVALAELLQLPHTAALHLGGKDAPVSYDFREAVFIDTETSGLAGGAGTIVFLTGVGRYEEDTYVVRQYFARNPSEEPACLTHLADFLTSAQSLVSFNGKAFDIPLLRTRFILAGINPNILQLPHLDLLHPARRLWRARLGSCTFGRLEKAILHHQRTTLDIPSWQIPEIWFRFARGENNISEISSILYHNQEDVVSMVPLAQTLGGVLTGVLPPHPDDLLALARYFRRQGDITRAKATYLQALEHSPDTPPCGEAMMELAALIKKQQGRAAALTWWLEASELPDVVLPHIELAKYHEWESGDLREALAWTEKAIARVQTWAPSVQRTQTLAELEHRQQRLQRKLRQ